MIVLGLTGSIAMGKSEAARMLRRMGVPVFDSDAAVHAMLEPGGAAAEAVGAAFPEALRDGVVDRARLGALVFDDTEALRRLESILHPRVRAAQHAFLECCAERGAEIAALDIPLLFETDANSLVDYVAVVSAPAEVQRRRALAREGMTPERLEAVLRQQMPDDEKRRRADYVLPSGDGKRPMQRAIAAMVRDLRGCSGKVWPWRGKAE